MQRHKVYMVRNKKLLMTYAIDKFKKIKIW